MTVALWCALAFVAIACIADMVTVAHYHRDLDELRAERDALAGDYHSPADRLAALETYTGHLAAVVTATEQPSTGRHAHSGQAA